MKRVRKCDGRCLDMLIILIAWMLWKHMNARVFGNSQRKLNTKKRQDHRGFPILRIWQDMREWRPFARVGFRRRGCVCGWRGCHHARLSVSCTLSLLPFNTLHKYFCGESICVFGIVSVHYLYKFGHTYKRLTFEWNMPYFWNGGSNTIYH
jgi:hypothetical protein